MLAARPRDRNWTMSRHSIGTYCVQRLLDRWIKKTITTTLSVLPPFCTSKQSWSADNCLRQRSSRLQICSFEKRTARLNYIQLCATELSIPTSSNKYGYRHRSIAFQTIPTVSYHIVIHSRVIKGLKTKLAQESIAATGSA
jgi:hypothetical protein